VQGSNSPRTASPAYAATFQIAFGFALLSLLLSWLVSARGFHYVSDDDFARTVIAQRFSEHIANHGFLELWQPPALKSTVDPSGTSWLPLPFWLTGIAMKLFAPTFATARIVSAMLTAASSALLFVTLRDAQIIVRNAAFGTALVLLIPWHLYASAAAVPEAYTATLVAIGLTGLVHPRGLQLWHAFAIFAATLCRYEPWTAAVLLAALSFVPKRGELVASRIAVSCLCVLGLLLWMRWNSFAHDGPLHFYRRVSSFKEAHDARTQGRGPGLWLYPQALWRGAPEFMLILPAAFACILHRNSRRLGLCLLGMVVLLLVSAALEGAPTHHPERAWLPVATALFALLPHVVEASTERFGRYSVPLQAGALGSLLLVLCLRVFAPSPFENTRMALVKEGELLRTSEHLEIAPCAYEHFALIAGYAMPSRVRILPSQSLGPCPHVH
jgi:hypothetical protein